MYPLVGFVDESLNIWCSTFPETYHVNMTFTRPVVVEGITSRGAFDNGVRHFVLSFSVFVSPSLDPDEELELLDKVYLLVNSSLVCIHACVCS